DPRGNGRPSRLAGPAIDQRRERPWLQGFMASDKPCHYHEPVQPPNRGREELPAGGGCSALPPWVGGKGSSPHFSRCPCSWIPPRRLLQSLVSLPSMALEGK